MTPTPEFTAALQLLLEEMEAQNTSGFVSTIGDSRDSAYGGVILVMTKVRTHDAAIIQQALAEFAGRTMGSRMLYKPDGPPIDSLDEASVNLIRALHQHGGHCSIVPMSIPHQPQIKALAVAVISRESLVSSLVEVVDQHLQSNGMKGVSDQSLAATSPAPASGAELISLERESQIHVKGYSAEHDDQHGDGTIVTAAELILSDIECRMDSPEMIVPSSIHWTETLRRRVLEKYGGDWVRRLVIAGALIAAEIDRLQRVVAIPPRADPLPPGDVPF